MGSSLANAVKSEYNAIRIRPQAGEKVYTEAGPSLIPQSVYDTQVPQYPPIRSPCLGVHHQHNLQISQRTDLTQEAITLYGWPSRGGVIVLEDATPPDFDFLRINPIDPPLRRDEDQAAEDAFCQGLLRLGAKWWDSPGRRRFVSELAYGDEQSVDAVDADESLTPSRRECCWVCVAWPSEPAGTLCVLEFEKDSRGRMISPRRQPEHIGLVSLARNMDERCKILQHLGGTMYASIDEYEGLAFLKAWEENHQGEERPLVAMEYIQGLYYDYK